MAGAAEKEKQICFRCCKEDGGVEVYLADLTNGVKLCRFLEEMGDTEYRWNSRLVALNSVVYSIGGYPKSRSARASRFDPRHADLPESAETFSYPISSDDNPSMSNDVFVFDAKSPTSGWSKSSSPVSIPDTYPSPMSHKGRIFTFVNKKGVEIYDPSSNSWKLQTLPDFWGVSNPIISDPYKDRILMHFRDRGLCEFRPGHDNQPLICLDPKFHKGVWSKRALILDNVLYLHKGGWDMPVRAYDLNRNKFLKVRWSSIPTPEIQWDEWQTFFLSGSGKLCLVGCWPLAANASLSKFWIVTFTVEKNGITILATEVDNLSFIFGGGPIHEVDFFTMDAHIDCELDEVSEVEPSIEDPTWGRDPSSDDGEGSDIGDKDLPSDDGEESESEGSDSGDCHSSEDLDKQIEVLGAKLLELYREKGIVIEV